MRIQIKYTIIIVILSFIYDDIYSQNHPTPYYLTEQNYVNADSNYLQNYGDPNKQMELFFENLENLCLGKSQKITILHLGGSHVKAGFWSWELRKKFEELCPYSEGPPGFVFPFSIAKTNHPYFYTSDFKGNWEFSKITQKELLTPVGLGGIAAITKDSIIEFSIQFTQIAEINKREFNKVIFLCNISDTSKYSITINPSQITDSIIIDSIENTINFYFHELQDSLNIFITKTDSLENEFIFYGAILENSFDGIRFISIGINGASTSSYLKAELFDEQIKIIKPDLVIFSLGVNDAVSSDFNEIQYQTNYQNLIDKVRKANPNCAIILTTNTDFFHKGKVNKNYKYVYNSMIELSRKNNCAVWDMFTVMGGEKSILLWRKNNLAKSDKIHFTKEGYEILAKLMFNAILSDFEKYMENKTNYSLNEFYRNN